MHYFASKQVENIINFLIKFFLNKEKLLNLNKQYTINQIIGDLISKINKIKKQSNRIIKNYDGLSNKTKKLKSIHDEDQNE